MNEIPLATIPDQSFSLTLDTVLYEFRIFLAANVMCCDLSINGTVILTSSRIVAGTPIIPYTYLWNGNFIINTMNGDLPDYTQFGLTQTMVYVSQVELGDIADV